MFLILVLVCTKQTHKPPNKQDAGARVRTFGNGTLEALTQSLTCIRHTWPAGTCDEVAVRMW